MQITIGKKNYDLNFGVRFVRELDKVAGVKVNTKGITQSFGMGLSVTMPSLHQYDPATLSDVLYCATWDNKQRPSQSSIDDYLDDDDTDVIKLFDEVNSEMNKANAIKAVMSKMPKNIKA